MTYRLNFRRCISILRFQKHLISVSTEPAAAHKAQDGTGGLQVRDRQGQWHHAQHVPGTFLINIGDLMMNWTNDRWVSTLHRVVAHPETQGRRRSSMPFFHNPNPDAVIECIPSCLREGENPKYAPMFAKTHLEEKVSKALGKTETMGDELIILES